MGNIRLLLILLLGAPQARAEPPKLPAPWWMIRDEDGIQVYRRDNEGSNLRSSRAIGTIKGRIPKLVALLADIPRMPQWTVNCLKAVVVEKNFTSNDYSKNIGDYYEIGYAINRVPWPLEERDYLLRTSVSLISPALGAPKHLVIHAKGVTHPKYPEVDAYVRVPAMDIKIDMVPDALDSEKTLIDFEILIDPGGMIPAFVVNAVSKALPFRTIKNIEILGQTEDYDRDLEKLVQYHYEHDQPLVGTKAESARSSL